MDDKSYKTLEEKRGDLVELPLKKLVISELNARHAFIDEAHVKELAEMMAAYGFRKERAIQINVIRDASGQVPHYRVVAGAHRFLGAKRAGLVKIPCHLYFELTEEEECFLDTIDNKIDEKRKRVHFLAEAEHYKYLIEKKGWSQLQISRVKGVSRSTIQWKLKIAALPDEAKTELLNNCHHGGTLTERHLREILKLENSCHIVLIIKEIVESEEFAEEGGGGGENSTPPLRQREVEERVRELLEMEARGEVSPSVVSLVEEVQKAEEREEDGRASGIRRKGKKARAAREVSEGAKEVADEEEAFFQEMLRARLEAQRGRGAVGVEAESRTTETMKFDVVPRWLRHSSLRKELSAEWDLWEQLIKFELRYLHGIEGKGEGDGYFFVEGRERGPEGSYLYLAGLTAQKTAGTVKKKLRRLVQGGFLQMQQANLPRYPRFRIVWSKLKEVYDQEAWEIPFEEGGLEGIPASFSGTIRPTPVHTIWVREGWVHKEKDHALAETMEQLRQIGASKKFTQKLLAEHSYGAICDAIKQYEREKAGASPSNGSGKQRPLDVFMGYLKGREPDPEGVK